MAALLLIVLLLICLLAPLLGVDSRIRDAHDRHDVQPRSHRAL
jgi:hypothetical protein